MSLNGPSCQIHGAKKTCNIFIINPFFSLSLPCRYFTAEAGNLSTEQLDVCTVTLQTLAAACVDNGQILVVLETLHIQSRDYHRSPCHRHITPERMVTHLI